MEAYEEQNGHGCTSVHRCRILVKAPFQHLHPASWYGDIRSLAAELVVGVRPGRKSWVPIPSRQQSKGAKTHKTETTGKSLFISNSNITSTFQAASFGICLPQFLELRHSQCYRGSYYPSGRQADLHRAEQAEGPVGRQERAVQMPGPVTLQGQRIGILGQEAVVAYHLLEGLGHLDVGSHCWLLHRKNAPVPHKC